MEDLTKSANGENFAEMLAQHSTQSEKLQPGQKIEGVIIDIAGDDVFVDVGAKQDGVLDYKEVLDKDGNPNVAVGDRISAFVLNISSQGVRISKSMHGSGIAALESARDAGVPVDGRIKAVVKGGYQIDVLGKQAFCPGSQMEYSPAGSNEDLVGRQMQFLVSRIENNGRNIVVSRRALLDREKKESMEKLLSSVKEGDIVEGRVSRLAPFGAFVELAPGIEGMIHLSELSWSRVATPEEAVSSDEMIRVKILAIGNDEKGRFRISLSRKQAMEDPWADIASKFKVGDVVEGKVVRFAPFGAFVEIAPGVDGLVHLSEMSWAKRINKPEEALSIGDNAQVAIKEINPDTRRVSLSLRDVLGNPWEKAAEEFPEGSKVDGVVENKSPYGLFVSLAPGITGLLPNSAIRNAPRDSNLVKLEPGDQVSLLVQKVDSVARRISLMPETPDNPSPEEDKSWRQHTKTRETAAEESGGLMAQALRNAFQKKNQGVKKE